MHKLLVGLSLALVPVAGLHAMPLNTFLEKATRLESRGPLALLSSDLGLLKTEIQNSAPRLRNERLAAERAGRRPAFCPPAQGGASLNSSEILQHFRSIPPAQRANMQVIDGMRSLMARKYPCPNS